MEEFKPEMYIFIDETGSVRRNSIRQYEYGIRGLAPVTQQLCIYVKRISAIGVMSIRGIEDTYIAEGTVDWTRNSYLVQHFGLTLQILREEAQTTGL